jgi:hypothetical protein
VRQRRSGAINSTRSTHQSVRNRVASKGALDKRLERVESLLSEILQNVDVNGKRLTALQAQLDHLSAKSRPV